MENNKKLLKTDISILIKQLAIPASTGMFFNTMYNVVDTFYASLISVQAVAALSLSFMVFFLVIGCGYGFSSGLTALIGNTFGRRKSKVSSIYAHQGLVLIPLVGVSISIFGFYFAEDIFIFLGATTKEYLNDVLAYTNVILVGVLFFMLNFALNAILVATGDTKSYRNSLIFGFFANVLLNPLFIYGFLFIPAMGIEGIALSTVLIQIINMLYLLKKVLKTNIINLNCLSYFIPDSRVYLVIIKQGLPASMNMFSMAIGSLLVIYFVSSYGVNAVAGYGIGFRVEQIMLLPALGISTAVLTLISNNFGAKKYTRVKETLYYSLKYGFTICFFGIVFLYIFGEYIIRLFNDNESVVDYAVNYLFVEVFIFFAFFTIFVCVSTLQGIKRPNMVFYISLYRQIVAKSIVGYLIVHYFKLEIFWFWIGLLVMTYSAAIFLFLYTRNRLKEFHIDV